MPREWSASSRHSKQAGRFIRVHAGAASVGQGDGRQCPHSKGTYIDTVCFPSQSRHLSSPRHPQIVLRAYSTFSPRRQSIWQPCLDPHASYGNPDSTGSWPHSYATPSGCEGFPKSLRRPPWRSQRMAQAPRTSFETFRCHF